MRNYFELKDEPFIEEFSCALQQGVPRQGKLFLTAKHLFFYSKMLKLKTAEKLDFSKITGIEKKKTFTIPNAIEIKTEDATVRIHLGIS